MEGSECLERGIVGSKISPGSKEASSLVGAPLKQSEEGGPGACIDLEESVEVSADSPESLPEVSSHVMRDEWVVGVRGIE